MRIGLIWVLLGLAATVAPVRAQTTVPASAPAPAVTGADVTETAERVLYVDQLDPNAADTNPGTEERPLKTISEAARRAKVFRAKVLGVKILIHPGVYRERIEVGSGAPEESAPGILFEGTKPGAVIVSGSDLFDQWQREEGGDVYHHPWPQSWGLAPIPPGWDPVKAQVENNPVLRRGEMVFIDGHLLRQVMSPEALRQQEQSFYVEDKAPDKKEGTIWIHAAKGTDLAKAKVEVAVRPEIFVGNGIGALVLRNLVFEHAATRMQGPAVRISGCANVLIDNCRFEWNNWQGLGLDTSRDITLRHVIANDNGAGGLGCWRVINLLVEDSEASANNWRGAWGHFDDWATGQKFFSLHGGRFVRFKAMRNQATGLWFDTDNSQVLVENSQLDNNQTRGLFIEANQGPITIRNSRICDNGQQGVLITNSANGTLEGDTITGNGAGAIAIPWLVPEHEVRTERNFETGQEMAIKTLNWTFRGNTIGGAGKSMLLSIGQWPWFLQSLISSGNHWYHADAADVFAVYPKRGGPPRAMDLKAWQELSGQDKDSTFASRPPPAR